MIIEYEMYAVDREGNISEYKIVSANVMLRESAALRAWIWAQPTWYKLRSYPIYAETSNFVS